jgi:hypothetical protein
MNTVKIMTLITKLINMNIMVYMITIINIIINKSILIIQIAIQIQENIDFMIFLFKIWFMINYKLFY